MPGLDPGIHQSPQGRVSEQMDCRVKPGNDESELRCGCLKFESQPSSPGLTGRSSIPETPMMESKGRGALDTPLARL
jgi:hypothetical protein